MNAGIDGVVVRVDDLIAAAVKEAPALPADVAARLVELIRASDRLRTEATAA